MGQETSSENSEFMQKALNGLEKLERHFQPDHTAPRKKLAPKKEGARVAWEAQQLRVQEENLNFLRAFKEKLQAGETLDLRKVFAMYFEMLVAQDGVYNEAELKEFMGSLIIASKVTGAYFVHLPSTSVEDIPETDIATSIQETREEFGL